MALPLNNALIIGGGFSGMSAAIELSKLGLKVDLVEIDPDWSCTGAGISIGGPTLRALDTVGVLDKFIEQGVVGEGLDLYTATGHLIKTLPTKKVVGANVPGGGAIMRPVLAKILSEAVLAAGVNVRLACTFSSLSQDEEGVDVVFTDKTSGRYDMVVGADGLNSTVREAIFPNAVQPKYSGQGVWRAVLPRPAHINNAVMWYGGELKVGVNPVSADEVYLFLTENRVTNDFVEPSLWRQTLKGLLSPEVFPAKDVQAFRAQINEDTHVNYRPLEGMLLPQPWYTGRIALIGDTIHATTPHLAMGAGIGIEDAIVLAEELVNAPSVSRGLDSFEARRWERCRMVVENSRRLGEIEIENGSQEEHARIMRNSMASLVLPV